MKNMHAMVLFLVFITSVSSTLCVSSNNDDNQKISMVTVEDQPTVHDAGLGFVSKENPAKMAILILEDGKVLKFSRKSSPAENCIDLYQPCGALDHCCDPYYCTGYFTGTCVTYKCQRTGLPCISGTPCCGVCVAGVCVG